MKPYGIVLKDRRKMYDYSSDKFNSRGCMNLCQCNLCKANGKKHKIRKVSSRKRTNLAVVNRMRTAKKRARQLNNKLTQE